MKTRILALGLSAAALLLVPPMASADTFLVNSTADTSDADPTDGRCDINTDAATEECTLRAALEEGNGNGGESDDVNFDTGSSTSLGMSPTITVPAAAAFPVLTSALNINGCSASPNSGNPCVGLRSDTAGSGTGLNFNSGVDVTIRGIAFTNWGTALRYDDLETSTGVLDVQNNWFGTKIDGVTNEANQLGIAHQGDGAAIGGDENGDGPTERNVFSNNSSTALQISAGDGNMVQGNYFGTTIDGTAVSTGTGNAEAIEVVQQLTPTPQDRPENTVIGGTAPVTPTCDGVCNLIATSTASTFPWTVDLWGESAVSEASAGSTTIAGNFIGLDKAGTAVLGVNNAAQQVRVGDADQVTIGGSAAGDANFITGGGYGIHAQGDDLVVDGNFIGTNPAGTAAVTPPALSGATVYSVAAAPATVSDNVVGYSSAYGVEVGNQGGELSGNSIGVGTGDNDIGSGSGALRVLGNGWTIDSNTIGNSNITGVELQQGDNNVITGNFIGTTSTGTSAPVGQAGIRITGFAGIDDFATGNTIGGDTAAEENVISNTNATFGDGIRIEDNPSGENNNIGNDILRNRGANHGQQFIDLANDGRGNPASGPNGGIQFPTVTTANTATISGVAEPGAVVRVFETQTLEGSVPTDIASFVGKVTANATTGAWTLSCPSADCAAAPAVGDRITASQTTAADGTSELADAETVVAPPDSDGDGVTDASDNCPSVANPNQANHDGDGQGNACDGDDDNDGKADGADACPTGAGSGTDTDGDGCFNSEDSDDDNDGKADASDACPTGASSGTDTDGDGCFNSEDPDIDGDGVPNGQDNCPTRSNAGQQDSDGDGVGDTCDPSPLKDVRSPEQELAGKRTQDVDKVKLAVTSSEDASLTGSGVVKLAKGKGGKRAYAGKLKFKPVTAEARASVRISLRFKLATKARKKVKAAIDDGVGAKAKLTVHAEDADGNASEATKLVKLKD